MLNICSIYLLVKEQSMTLRAYLPPNWGMNPDIIRELHARLLTDCKRTLTNFKYWLFFRNNIRTKRQSPDKRRLQLMTKSTVFKTLKTLDYHQHVETRTLTVVCLWCIVRLNHDCAMQPKQCPKCLKLYPLSCTNKLSHTWLHFWAASKLYIMLKSHSIS